MEQLNQRISKSHSSRMPLVLVCIFCSIIIGMAAYTAFERSKPSVKEAAEDQYAPNIEYGRTMSRRLSELGLEQRAETNVKEDSISSTENSSQDNFWDSYFKYLSLYERQPPQNTQPIVTALTPEPVQKIKEKSSSRVPQESTPSPEEQLQEQLRSARASALLQALKAETSVNASTNAANSLKQDPALNGINYGAAPAYASASFANTAMPQGSASAQPYLSPLQAQALQQGRQYLGAMTGNSTSVGAGSNFIGSEQTLAAYEGLTNNNTLLSTHIETVLSPFLLRQGALIPCVLLTGINSDLPGLVQAQVTADVFDSPQGEHLLIPKGSKIIGQYAAAPMLGQERLMLAFNRVIFPDGKAMGLGAMPGSSPDGYAGFNAKVDTHFWRLMGNAILLGGITAGVSLSVDDEVRDDDGNLTLNGALTQSLGQSMGRVLTNIIERNMAISPTLQVHPGFLFNVTLTKDIYFPSPYQPYVY